MLFRTHPAEDAVQTQNPPAEGPAGGDVNQVREAGESLFRAADEAIRRALSGDSRAFLEATQQSGGQ